MRVQIGYLYLRNCGDDEELKFFETYVSQKDLFQNQDPLGRTDDSTVEDF